MRHISFSKPDITQEEINEVVDTLKSGWITTGPKTKLFEKKLAEYCHTNRAVAMNSATACMDMVLKYLGIGLGDEVITSAYTYSASASVVAHNQGTIVLADVAKDSFHIDYESLKDKINENTKVIIPVDIAGIMCDYDRLYEIVMEKKHLYKPDNDIQKKFGRIVILADAAHSFGATYKGRMNGSIADFTCFSFHAVKNLTTGEGGAVTWRKVDGLDDEEIYKGLQLLSLHGQTKDALSKNKLGMWEYDIVAPNYKCNMTDIMASLGLVQLKRYPDILKRREVMINKYSELLVHPRIIKQTHYGENTSSGHLYLVRIEGIDEVVRNEIIVKLAEKEIATNVHFKPLPLLTAYKNLGFEIKDYPNAHDMYKNEISLPLHTLMTDEDLEYVAKCLLEILEEVI